MAAPLGNLLLNALQLLQGGATQAEVAELLRRGGATSGDAQSSCPTGERSEAEQEAIDHRADLFLLDGEHARRDCSCPEELCVHVVGLDHGY